jgi:hypothetical protein
MRKTSRVNHPSIIIIIIIIIIINYVGSLCASLVKKKAVIRKYPQRALR